MSNNETLHPTLNGAILRLLNTITTFEIRTVERIL